MKKMMDIESLVIEKNIPIKSRKERWELLAKKMNVGDSILFSDYQKARGLFNAFKRMSMDCEGFTEGDSHRLWKTGESK